MTGINAKHVEGISTTEGNCTTINSGGLILKYDELIDKIADKVIEKMKATQERQLTSSETNVGFNTFAWERASYLNE